MGVLSSSHIENRLISFVLTFYFQHFGDLFGGVTLSTHVCSPFFLLCATIILMGSIILTQSLDQFVGSRSVEAFIYRCR